MEDENNSGSEETEVRVEAEEKSDSPQASLEQDEKPERKEEFQEILQQEKEELPSSGESKQDSQEPGKDSNIPEDPRSLEEKTNSIEQEVGEEILNEESERINQEKVDQPNDNSNDTRKHEEENPEGNEENSDNENLKSETKERGIESTSRENLIGEVEKELQNEELELTVHEEDHDDGFISDASSLGTDFSLQRPTKASKTNGREVKEDFQTEKVERELEMEITEEEDSTSINRDVEKVELSPTVEIETREENDEEKLETNDQLVELAANDESTTIEINQATMPDDAILSPAHKNQNEEQKHESDGAEPSKESKSAPAKSDSSIQQIISTESYDYIVLPIEGKETTSARKLSTQNQVQQEGNDHVETFSSVNHAQNIMRDIADDAGIQSLSHQERGEVRVEVQHPVLNHLKEGTHTVSSAPKHAPSREELKFLAEEARRFSQRSSARAEPHKPSPSKSIQEPSPSVSENLDTLTYIPTRKPTNKSNKKKKKVTSSSQTDGSDQPILKKVDLEEIFRAVGLPVDGSILSSVDDSSFSMEALVLSLRSHSLEKARDDSERFRKEVERQRNSFSESHGVYVSHAGGILPPEMQQTVKLAAAGRVFQFLPHVFQRFPHSTIYERIFASRSSKSVLVFENLDADSFALILEFARTNLRAEDLFANCSSKQLVVVRETAARIGMEKYMFPPGFSLPEKVQNQEMKQPEKQEKKDCQHITHKLNSSSERVFLHLEETLFHGAEPLVFQIRKGESIKVDAVLGYGQLTMDVWGKGDTLVSNAVVFHNTEVVSSKESRWVSLPHHIRAYPGGEDYLFKFYVVDDSDKTEGLAKSNSNPLMKVRLTVCVRGSTESVRPKEKIGRTMTMGLEYNKPLIAWIEASHEKKVQQDKPKSASGLNPLKVPRGVKPKGNSASREGLQSPHSPLPNPMTKVSKEEQIGATGFLNIGQFHAQTASSPQLSPSPTHDYEYDYFVGESNKGVPGGYGGDAFATSSHSPSHLKSKGYGFSSIGASGYQGGSNYQSPSYAYHDPQSFIQTGHSQGGEYFGTAQYQTPQQQSQPFAAFQSPPPYSTSSLSTNLYNDYAIGGRQFEPNMPDFNIPSIGTTNGPGTDQSRMYPYQTSYRQ